MIDAKIENETITERGIYGCASDLILDVVTLAAYVLDFAAKDETTYLILRDILAESIMILNYGNIREEQPPK